MARKSSKSKNSLPDHDDAEFQDGETFDEAGGDEAGPGISKAEAARRAIAAGFGKPQQGSEYIKSTFGLDVSPQHFSAIKSTMKKKDASPAPEPKSHESSKRGRPANPPASHSTPPAAKAPSGDSGSLLEALEALKPLVAEMGPEKLKRMVDLLG